MRRGGVCAEKRMEFFEWRFGTVLVLVHYTRKKRCLAGAVLLGKEGSSDYTLFHSAMPFMKIRAQQ